LFDRVTAVWLSYRKYCATSHRHGQLILPETLKVLPSSTLVALKTALFVPLPVPYGRAPHVDQRATMLYMLSNLPLAQQAALLYPRVWAVHSFTEEVGRAEPENRGMVNFPTTERAMRQFLDPRGIYL